MCARVMRFDGSLNRRLLGAGVHAGLGYRRRRIAMAVATGKMRAERARGKGAAELPVPAAPLRPLPLHGIVVRLSRAMVLPCHWADRRRGGGER